MIITFTKTVSVDVDTNNPISFAELEGLFAEAEEEATIQPDFGSGFITNDEDLQKVFDGCGSFAAGESIA